MTDPEPDARPARLDPAEPAKFRAYLEAEIGKRAAELVTVGPGDDKGGHHSLYRTDAGATVAPAVAESSMSPRKEKNLRAILRAPEAIQNLYRDGLISQTVAAADGPRSRRRCPGASESRRRGQTLGSQHLTPTLQ